MDAKLKQSLEVVAQVYDQRKVADDIGALGFWRSSDLKTLLLCLETLEAKGLLGPDSIFLDMGCGDGRVNVLMSYFVKISVGIEFDEWTLDDYLPLRQELERMLESRGLLLPPSNIYLFYGNSYEEKVYQEIYDKVGLRFEDFDIFYTYLVGLEEFSCLIAAKAKPGAIFMCYGLNKIMPRYEGLTLLDTISPLEGILAIYKKEK